jgi:hypothetical protein
LSDVQVGEVSVVSLQMRAANSSHAFGETGFLACN